MEEVKGRLMLSYVEENVPCNVRFEIPVDDCPHYLTDSRMYNLGLSDLDHMACLELGDRGVVRCPHASFVERRDEQDAGTFICCCK